MGLKERSIAAHEKEKEKIQKENILQEEKFAVQAEEIIRGRIGDEFAIRVISKKPSETIFAVDGIMFSVSADGVCIVRNCPKCGSEYYEDLAQGFGDKEKVFQDIGKILSKPHNDYDCKKALRDKEGNKELTTEEKLLQVLKDFVQEHTGECLE